MLRRTRADKLIEKATSDLLVEPDIATSIEICDYIRSQELPAKATILALKKRLLNGNSNVVMHSLYVLESLMKNCGQSIHEEVITDEFISVLSSLATSSNDVQSKVLECIQNWAFVFKDKPTIQRAREKLEADGYTFPPFSESDAMFSVTTAPNWKEETICHRCKVAFTTFRRRHHCRNCGNSYCAECSNEKAVLPKFGIEKEVRVCNHCFEQLTNKSGQSEPSQKETKPKERRLAEPDKEVKRKELERKNRELATQEAEELQLALALSASEAESKEHERRSASNHMSQPTSKAEPAAVSTTESAMNGSLRLLPVLDTTEMDPELARYLNRHYWENRASAGQQQQQEIINSSASYLLQPSAPFYSPSVASTPTVVSSKLGAGSDTDKGLLEVGNENNHDHPLDPEGQVPPLSGEKQEEFLGALKASIDFFINRMHSDNLRNRNIANDTTVQTLFLTLHEMHPQLLQQKHALERRRAYYEQLQDKITQLRDAREALDALQAEHAAQRQLEEQEAARMQQLQMLQKLEAMRQQKRDALEFKRRMAFEQTMAYQQQYGTQIPQHMPIADLYNPPAGAGTPYLISDAYPYQPVYSAGQAVGGTLYAAPSGQSTTVNYGYGGPTGPEASAVSYGAISSQPIEPGNIVYGAYPGGQHLAQAASYAAEYPQQPSGTNAYNMAQPQEPTASSFVAPPSTAVAPPETVPMYQYQQPPTSATQQMDTGDPNMYNARMVYEQLPDAPTAALPSVAAPPTRRVKSPEGHLIAFD